jgi:hypothetical protein
MYLLQRASPGEIESQIIRLIRLSTDSESEMSDSGGDDNGEDDGDDRVVSFSLLTPNGRWSLKMYLLQRASPGEIESQIIRLIRLIRLMQTRLHCGA